MNTGAMNAASMTPWELFLPVGWPALLPFLVWTAMAGGLLGVVIGIRLLYVRYVREEQAGKNVPYGIALAAGAIIALPQSGWMLG